MASGLDALIQIVAPKKKGKPGGTTATSTFNPQTAAQVLTVPQYQDHLSDLMTDRQSDDSRTLLKSLFKNDPDVSAAVFSYLTMANTRPVILVRDMNNEIDRDATKSLLAVLKALFVPTDYTLGFQLKRNLTTLCEEMRYMTLLRGGVSTELVLDKTLAPQELRMVDMASLKWYEKTPGQYKPVQLINSVEVSLDIPTFFVSFFRRDPTEIYSTSTFVSAINTIAARQQVINDLYRIMQRTGYPRLDVKVVEEVLAKNAPASLRTDPSKLKDWMNSRMSEIRSAFEGVRPDQAYVHFDAIEPSIINDKNPGMGVDISKVIDTLNSQNQAGLKTMATVIGRGSAGVNTSSVEARIAAMNADELNDPIAEVLTNVCSFIMHQSGYQGFAEVYFEKAELRPDLELEPQMTLKAARLRQDLSDGLITDDEYHLMLYGRMKPDSAPELSGTGFNTPQPSINAADVSPNQDALGRSISSKGAKTTKSNAVKSALAMLGYGSSDDASL